MRITCLITVCAYLSSTVSTDEIKFLNRIKRVKSREELVVKDVNAGKKINPTPQIYSDVLPILQKSRPKTRIETFQKSKRTRGSQFGPQQHHHYGRGHSKRLPKHVKTRSIDGAPFELNDNQLNKLTKEIPEFHDERPIHIEPVLRITTKKNVFDSIMDILRQLLNPPKNELGPLVGPIQVPGSKRKIYLRLMQPVDSSHVTVRFVTQVPVPVIDAEKHGSVIQIPSIIDPVTMLLNGHYNGVPSNALFDSSNRHHPIHSLRNINHTSDKNQSPIQEKIKPSILDSPKDLLKNFPSIDTDNKQSFSPDKEGILSGAEIGKNSFVDTQLDFENDEHTENQFHGSGSYYQYQSDEDATKQVKEFFNDTTTIEHHDTQESPEPWYQLNTYRLPLRQVASLTSIEHSDSKSYSDAYKVPSDVFTEPNSYSPDLIKQYNDANSAPEFYANSYDQQSVTSNSYSTFYNKQNDKLYSTPSTTAYQQQNEFNSEPNFYSNSYQNQDEFNNTSGFYPSSYTKQQNDLYAAASSYSNSYEKPKDISSSRTFYKKQNNVEATSNFNDALRIIDPPYFPDYQKTAMNYVNRSSVSTAIRQPRYNLHNFNKMVTNTGQNNESLFQRTIWGKREKSKSSSQKPEYSPEINRDKWQPVAYVRENADWHEVAYTDLTQVASNQRESEQPLDRAKKISSRDFTISTERGTTDRRQNSKRRGTATVTRSSRCSTSGKENGCEQTKSTNAPVVDSEKIRKIVKKQTQPVINIEPTTTLKSTTDNTIEFFKSDVTTKNPKMSSTTSSTTEKLIVNEIVKSTTSTSPLMRTSNSSVVSNRTQKSLPLVKTTKSPATSSKTGKLIMDEIISKPTMSDIAVKLEVGSTTKKPTIRSTTEAPVSSTLTFLKRPMTMKKSMFIMKKIELSSTAKSIIVSGRTTQKPMSSTTKRTTTQRRSFRRMIPKTKLNVT